MNKANLKSYAPQARKDFIAAVTARTNLLGLSDKAGTLEVASAQTQGDVTVIAGQAWPAKVSGQRDKLVERISKDGFAHTMEAVELAELVTNTDKDLRLGEKRAASILQAIDATRTLTVAQFLGSLGLEHLGKRRVELMMKSADGALNTLADWRSGQLRDAAMAVKAGVPNIGGQIQDGIDAMASVIDKLLAAGVTALSSGVDTDASNAVLLKTICISGKLPSGKKKADYEAPLRAVGYELVEDVSKELKFLVLADPTSTSSKADKAKKFGIEVISEDQLLRLVESVALSVQVDKAVIKKSEQAVMSSNATDYKFDGQFKRFEFIDEKSSKFWEMQVNGNKVEIRYGKIGSSGQAQVKEFGDEPAAHKHAEKIIGEKLKGGYVASSEATDVKDQTAGQSSVKSSTRELVKKLKLDEKQNLTGEFPRELDLGNLRLLDFGVFFHDSSVFSKAFKQGLAPQANLAISNNATLEFLRIPSDDLGMTYVLVENCVNLKTIEVYGYSPTSRSSEPKWLICKDLPNLESVVAAGPLLSLQIDNVPNLKVINVGRCAELALLSLRGASNLQELDINGCRKLPCVQGLTEKQEVLLSVESKIVANCAIANEAAFPFQNLNFRQIDEVLDIINKGMMADFENGRPNQHSEDASIEQFSVRLLRPLETTYTGGTGEQYAYELIHETGTHLDELVGNVSGEHSPEECLNSALRYVQGFIIIDDVDDPDEPLVFDYLKSYGKSTSGSRELQQRVVPAQNQVNSTVARTLCISGKLHSSLRKADYETALRNININLVDDVAKGLTYLVLADPASTSAKAEKARKLGVNVISEDELIELTSGRSTRS